MAHILVIDDDPVYSALIVCALERSGHRVSTVGNGREALFRLAETTFDLIITDILMPEMDGIEFIRRAPNGTRAPILAVSGYGSDRSINFLKVARLLGADASLRKPFAPDELRATVETLLSRRHLAPGNDDAADPPSLDDNREADHA